MGSIFVQIRSQISCSHKVYAMILNIKPFPLIQHVSCELSTYPSALWKCENFCVIFYPTNVHQIIISFSSNFSIERIILESIHKTWKSVNLHSICHVCNDNLCWNSNLFLFLLSLHSARGMPSLPFSTALLLSDFFNFDRANIIIHDNNDMPCLKGPESA